MTIVYISGEGMSNPLQYSCLEKPMDRGAWPATVHEAAELDKTEVTQQQQQQQQYSYQIKQSLKTVTRDRNDCT